MDPFTSALGFMMSNTGMATMAAGTVGLSAISAGQTAGAQADQAAQSAAENARIARQQGSAAEETQRRQGALRMGDMRASAAQSGFDPSSGSLAALQTRSAGEMELDALTSRYEGQLRSISLDTESSVQRANAKVARRGGYLSAAGSVSQVGASYLRGSSFSGTQTPAPVTSIKIG